MNPEDVVGSDTLETVYGLFTWSDGLFHFEPNQLPSDDVVTVPIDLENIILEGSRRVKEWERLQDELPNLDMALRFADRPGANMRNISMSVEEWRVVSFINPRNTIRQIAQYNNMSDFQVRKIDLSDDEKVRKVESSTELATMTLAGIYAAQGYYNKALKIYQDVVRDEPDNKEAAEMIEKLEILMNASEEERKGAFDDEVLTISLDDVSEEMASSTAGAGGMREDADEGSSAGSERTARAERKSVEKKSDELAEAMRELDKTEEEEGEEDRVKEDESAPEEKIAERADEAKEGEPHSGMDDFQDWVRRLRSDREKPE